MTTKKLLSCTLLSLLVGTLSAPLSYGTEAVQWRENLDAAKIEATQSGKLVLLHFFTTSCGPCRMLDESVFSQPQIAQTLEQNYVPVKIDADSAKALASAYQVERVPSEIVMTPQGNVVAKLTCPQNGPDYISQLSNLSEHYRRYQAQQGAPSQQPVQSAYAGLQVGQYQQQNRYAQSPNPQSTSTPGPNSPSQNPAAPQTGSPAVTNNPYASHPNNTVAAASPVASNAYAPPSANQHQQPAVAVPANAMPNSYQSQAASTAAMVPQSSPQNNTTAAVVQTNPATTQAATPAQVMNPAATQVTAASHIAFTAQLPEGSPPLAFDGYCPVTLRSAHKWVAGNPKFGAIHRGRTFLFTSEEQRQQFFSNPDAYCPVFSGMDPVLLLEQNQVVEGSRRFGFEYRGAFYLFASQESMERFKAQPDQFATGVKQAMNRMTTSAGGTVLK